MSAHVARLAVLILPFTYLLGTSISPDGNSDQTSERQVEHMMVKQFVCPGEGLHTMKAFIEEKLGPILSDLRDEDEMINDWGLLTHDWGDEYNVGFYMRADNHFEWYAAWIELMNRMQRQHGLWFEDVMHACTKHKDNLYIHYRYE